MGEGDEVMDESHGDEQVSIIVSMATSPDGQWLATGDLLNRIHVFNLDALQVCIYGLRRDTLMNFAHFAHDSFLLFIF